MARTKHEIVFSEVKNKTVEFIRYAENSDWQAIEFAFNDGTLLTLELSSHVEVRASYLKALKGNLKLIRNYGRVSGAPARRN